uniref:Fibronectin type-III domain-containing protein n=1 Tax=Candidatus Kentrum sp. DK TaxID=2126562 RepID=A0A450SXA1_9GAMM|nr:MAG: hypothetical protein BECKDK2373B_GA0170837_100551 [Candidatus Kentron sp. DK]VFJ58675.1 MAG: hypothetical protein BECKDK2373C_GA0170839_10677 [Candidatus Kentron sp. DK]
MRFPVKENDVFALGEKLHSGLKNNTDTYPDPPVPVEVLGATLKEYMAVKEEETANRAALEASVQKKNAVLETLSDEMRKEIRYAENRVDFDDAKLKQLGWGGRKTKTALQEPGQVLSLRVVRQGDGRITLAWKAPGNGGAVAAYQVQRLERLAANGSWIGAGMAMGTETTLENQERGKEFEFRTVAVNKAGEGEPSNTVMAVL